MHTSQGPCVSRRSTPSGSAQIASHLLGPHPVIAHFLERMNLEGILRAALGSARQGTLDHARTLTVLVHNLLGSPGPLYRIAEWSAPWEPQVLALTQEQKAALNDDRVARALDALSSERGRGIWFRLALRVIKQFEVGTDRVHFDTSTVSGRAGLNVGVSGGPASRLPAGWGNIGSHGPVPTQQVLGGATKWLGEGYREIAPGVFRSSDSLRQFRMTASDLVPTHGRIGSHVHFEALDPAGRVIENLHLPVAP